MVVVVVLLLVELLLAIMVVLVFNFQQHLEILEECNLVLVLTHKIIGLLVVVEVVLEKHPLNLKMVEKVVDLQLLKQKIHSMQDMVGLVQEMVVGIIQIQL